MENFRSQTKRKANVTLVQYTDAMIHAKRMLLNIKWYFQNIIETKLSQYTDRGNVKTHICNAQLK